MWHNKIQILHVYGPRGSQYPAIFAEQNWSLKDLLYGQPGSVRPTTAVHTGSKVDSSSFPFDRRSVNISARVSTRGFS